MSDTVELKYKEEDLKLLAGFTLLDDDFMTIVFDRNIGATELVLNIILGRKDLKVIEVVAQREYKNPVTGGRSIKLDIYAEDSDGRCMTLRYRMMMPGQTYTEPDFTAAC